MMRECRHKGEGCLETFEPTTSTQKNCVVCQPAARRETAKLSSRAYRTANKEKINAAKRAKRRADPERYRAEGRVRAAAERATDREGVNARQRSYYAANREHCRTLARSYYAADPEKFKARVRGRSADLRKLAALGRQMRDAQPKKPRRPRGHPKGARESTRARILLAAQLIHAGVSKRAMGADLFPEQNSPDARYTAVKRLFREHADEIEAERQALVAAEGGRKNRGIFPTPADAGSGEGSENSRSFSTLPARPIFPPESAHGTESGESHGETAASEGAAALVRLDDSGAGPANRDV